MPSEDQGAEASSGTESSENALTTSVTYRCTSKARPVDGFDLTANGYQIVLENVQVGSEFVREIRPLDFPSERWDQPEPIEGYTPFLLIGRMFPGTQSDTFYVARAVSGRKQEGGEVIAGSSWTTNDPPRYGCTVSP